MNDVYQDAAGLPTIGVGHLLTKDELASGKILILGEAIKYHDGLTNLQIDRLLTHDLAGSEGAVICFTINCRSGTGRRLNWCKLWTTKKR